MQLITISRRIRTVMLAFMIGLIALSTTAVSAQDLNLFQAPWRGHDTGIFGNGFAPASFAVGDLDGDGDPDILVGDSFAGGFENGGSGISVLKNNGDGTYSSPVYYPVSQNQTVGEVTLSDFDADGDLDAFATIRGNFDQMLVVKVWRNNGTGTFAAAVDISTGQGPSGIVIADLTGDGKSDVVTANYGASTVSVLKHNGLTGASAGFLAPVTSSAGNHAEKIAAGDVNGDGKVDIVVGGQTGSGFAASLAVMINNGTGGLAAPVAYDSAPGGRFGSKAVGLADLDNDGDLDLISGGLYSSGSVDRGSITIRRNNGAGTFGAPDIVPYTIFAAEPKEVATGDINGDGFADIVVTTPSGRSVEGFVTLASDGAGGFNAPIYYEASQQTFDAAILDVDADGDRDVVTVANSSAAITVHKNPGNGALPILPRYEVASLSDAVESADIDNDGDVDIVVNGEVDVASVAPVVKILKNNGGGTFAPATDYTPARNFADMKLRDINGDGFVDMIFAPDGNYPSYHLGTALNLGNGTFAPTVVFQLFACGEGTIDAADLDGDGDRDIVLTEEQACIGGDPNRIFILRNDGNQNFVRMPDITLFDLPHGLALADVTGDGKIDIITALSTGMGVYPNNGNFVFGAPVVSSGRPFKFKMADFNSDGKPDVGMIMPQDAFGTDTIATALGNGNGTFQSIRTQTGSSVLENLRISNDLEPGDIDGDGRLDLMTFNYASNDISVFVSNADGSLRPHQRYGIGNTPILGTLGDFDGDGKLDAAAAIGLPPSGLHNAVVVLRNTGTSGGTPTPTATATNTPTATPTATPAAVISGTVTYGNAIGAPTPRFVSNVLITGTGSPNISTTTTIPDGTYVLGGFGAGSYTVTASKTGGVNNITSFDAARISQHVAGVSSLSGTQMVVADVSGNGTVSSFDSAQVAGYVVSTQPFGTTGTWKFTPANRTYASVTGNVTGQDYVALLMGEVSGNWTNTGARPADRPERSTAVAAPRLTVRAGNEVIIPLSVLGTAGKGIIAYEFDLRYDPSVIQPLLDPVDVSGTVSSKLSFVVNAEEPGLLRVAVYGPTPLNRNGVLLKLRFNAVGTAGSVSPLTWERLMFNEGGSRTKWADGQVELAAMTGPGRRPAKN